MATDDGKLNRSGSCVHGKTISLFHRKSLSQFRVTATGLLAASQIGSVAYSWAPFDQSPPSTTKHMGIHHDPSIVCVGSKAARIHTHIIGFRNGPPRRRTSGDSVSNNGGGRLCQASQAVMTGIPHDGRSGRVFLSFLRHFNCSSRTGGREP